MRRVIVYIDGFNLYHAIDDLRRPWLNGSTLEPWRKACFETAKR
jgi:hypothetical protein